MIMVKSPLVFLIVLFLVMPLIADEADISEDELLKLLDSLKATKSVEEKFRKEDEGSGDQEVKESSAEILGKISKKMESVVDRMNKEMDFQELLKDKDAEKDIESEKERSHLRRDTILNEQKDIVKLIDAILDRAIQQQRRGSGGKGSGSSKSGGGSSAVITLPPPGGGGSSSGGGGGGINEDVPDRAEIGSRDREKEWGNLPDVLREEILQILQEDMPLLYKELLRLYFKNIDKE